MCRLYGFRASAPTRLECSLIESPNGLLAQSRRDARGEVNGQGWGIAHYRDGHPLVEKRPSAAFEDPLFTRIAKAIRSDTILAHVRSATVGRVRRANAHPFALGVWSFAHNGTLTAYDRVARRLEQETGGDLLAARRGSTDSELIFLWLLARMRRAGIDTHAPSADPPALAALFAKSVTELAGLSAAAGAEAPAQLNLLLTDGVLLLASCFGNSLHRLERDGVDDCVTCGRPHVEPRDAAGYHAALVASEPITAEAWRAVPDRHLVMIGPHLTSETVPLP